MAPAPTFWAVRRPAEEVRAFTLPVRSITDPAGPDRQVLGPGKFRR